MLFSGVFRELRFARENAGNNFIRHILDRNLKKNQHTCLPETSTVLNVNRGRYTTDMGYRQITYARQGPLVLTRCMATDADLTSEIQSLSSRLLESESSRSELDQLVRQMRQELQGSLRQASESRTALEQSEQRIRELEEEMSDFSTSLLDEANRQAGDANRRAALALRLVDEREIVIETQREQLLALKEMLESREDISSPIEPPSTSNPDIDPDDEEAVADALEEASYATPIRPLVRYDIAKEFPDFVALAGTESNWRKTKFGYRVISQDVEPALCLDTAVHLNWLTCRAWRDSVLDATFILEPVPQSERMWAKRPSHPCCLCGTQAQSESHARLHNAKLPRHEDENYPVCLSCLASVRAGCELVRFLKSLADGVRKFETKEQQRRAYDECVRLREQCFWARIGSFFPQQLPNTVVDSEYENAEEDLE